MRQPDGRKKLFLCITKSTPWGGAQKYVYDLATGLPKNEFDITVVAGPGELLKRLAAAGIRTVPLAHSQRDINLFKVFFVGLRLIALFRKERPDIVHLNSSQMGGSGALAARIAGVKKIIFTAHGWAFNEDRPAWQKTLIHFFHVLTLRLAHRTIVVADITRQQIGAPWNEKMTVIHNGMQAVDVLDRAAARTAIEKRIGASIPADAAWIGTISELHPTKGLAYAIDAVADLSRPAVFIVIGDGGYRNQLERHIAERGLGGAVFLAGRIEQAARYLAAFDIVTLTSITEALPYFLLEAGAAARPVVASAVGGIPEIIADGRSGLLVPPRDTAAIRGALERLLGDPAEAAALGTALREHIDRDFSEQAMLDRTVALYDGMI